MATNEITLPEGFQLDAPALPEGFTLDAPKSENPFHAVDLLGPAGTAYRMTPSVVSGFERGSAGLLKTLGSIGNYIADAATGPEPGTPNQVAEKFRNQWQNVLIDKISKNADYWDAKSQANHTDAITEAVGQAVGSLPPAMVDWLGNVPFAAAKGMAEAEQRGEGFGGQLKQGGIEAVKRATLGLIFHGLGGINNPIVRRGGGALVMGGTAVAEGERDPAKILASLMMGGILTGKSKGKPPEGFEVDKPVETTQDEPTREELIQRNVNPTPEEQADISKGNQEISDLLKERLTPEELAKMDLSKAPLESEITAQKIGLTAADIQNRDVIRENVDKLQPKDIDLLKPYAGEDWADKKIAELQKESVEVEPETKMVGGNKWTMKVPVDISRIVPNEEQPMTDAVENVKQGRVSKSKGAISLEKVGDRFILQDGYHRVAEAMARGETTIVADVMEKPITEAKTSKPQDEPDRNELVKMGHVIPRSLGWTTEQRRAFNKQITGKESMSDMNMTEMQSLADALQVEAVSAGKPYGQKKPKAIVAPNLPETPQTMTVGGQKLPAKIVLDGAVKDASTLHDQGPEPDILSAENGVVKEGLWKSTLSPFATNNMSIPALAEHIGAVFKGIVHTVFVEDYGEGHRATNKFMDDLLTTIPQWEKEAGISNDDLRQMSHTQDPRYWVIRKGAKLLGKARTPTHTFVMGKNSKGESQKVNMTDGNLISFYLSALQEGGVDHIKDHIRIWGRRVNGITDADIRQVAQYVEANPKIRAQCELKMRIAREKNNPAINKTFHDMGGDPEENIADNDHYFPLIIDTPEVARGKMAVNMSFIDNPRHLKERTGGGGGLIIGDAFDTFTKLEEEVGAYVGMAQPIQNMRTLLNYQPFIDTLDAKGLTEVRHKLLTLMSRAENPRQVESTATKVIQPLLSGGYRGVLQFNPRPILAEGIGEVQIMADEAARPEDAKKLGAAAKNPAGVKEMLEHSPTARMRFDYGTSSFELAELERNEHALTMFTGQHSDINKPSIMMKSFDAGKLYFGWQIAMERVGEEQPDLKQGSPEYWDAVEKRAYPIWQRNCPSWDRWNRSMNSSDPTIGRQVFFMFRSYWEKASSVLNRANLNYQYSDKGPEAKKQWVKAYGWTMASILANSTVRVMVGQYLWKKKRTLAQNVADIVTSPFQIMAVAGGYLQSMTSSFIQLATKQKLEPSFAANQSLPLEMVTMVGTSAADYMKAAGSWVGGDREKAKKELKKAIMSSVMIGGLAGGMPVYVIQDFYRAWIQKEKTGDKRNYNVATRGH